MNNKQSAVPRNQSLGVSSSGFRVKLYRELVCYLVKGQRSKVKGQGLKFESQKRKIIG